MVFSNKKDQEEKKEDDRHQQSKNHDDVIIHNQHNTEIPNVGLTNETEDLLDVVIVGAGWAGLSAAATLKEQGLHNFKILEAKDHIGGRSFTHYEEWEGQNVALDLGAMWIQNAEGNLLYDYIKKYKIPTHPSTFKTRVYKENGKGRMKDKEYERLEEELFERGFHQFQAERQDSASWRGEESLQMSADLYIKTLKKKPAKQKLAKLLIRDQIELEYSGSLAELSLKHWDSDSWIGDTKSHDHFVMTGYSALVYAYAKEKELLDKVVLNAPISTIDASDHNLIQLTSNGVNIQAKSVIVTVPLGVLQANAIQFVPAIPKSTSNAIQRLGMGKMNKIFLLWNSKDIFWPMPSSNFEVLGDVTDRDSNFLFYNSLSFHGTRPALYAFFKGPEVEQLELELANQDPALYEEKICELAMQSLQSMFGNIPRPEKVVVTRWLADEYTRGAYSFNKVGMKSRDREVLRYPIAGERIHFAGEATHDTYFGTTTGAFLTGRDAAKKVVQKL